MASSQQTLRSLDSRHSSRRPTHIPSSRDILPATLTPSSRDSELRLAM